MKIVLGTAQFGSKYGISNQGDFIDSYIAREIINYAQLNGIDTIDTAASYENSESILGNMDLRNFRVITKLSSPNNIDKSDLTEWINNQVKLSMSKLKVSQLEGLLIHNTIDMDLNTIKMIWNNMKILKEKRIVNKIGFSIYDPSEIEVWIKYCNPDIVQCPYNVFDRRIVYSSFFEELKKNGTQIHARSIFLQGLLLMEKNKMPQYFQKWNEVFIKWKEWLMQNKLSPLEGCLNFAYNEKNLDKIVIGIENKKQLEQILSFNPLDQINYIEDLSVDDVELLNPYMWKLK